MSFAHLDTHPDIRHPVRMPSFAALAARSEQEQQPDLSSWPTHTEAAAQLATNERTIRRWIEAGRLKAAYRPAAGRKPIAVVDPADIERLRTERQPVLLVEAVQTSTNPDSMPDVRIAPAPGSPRGGDPFAGLAAHLARLAAAFPAAQPKPWLTLSEAEAYSGLPRAWLIAQARSGALRAVNVGQGTKEFWRFNREGLAK